MFCYFRRSVINYFPSMTKCSQYGICKFFLRYQAKHVYVSLAQCLCAMQHMFAGSRSIFRPPATFRRILDLCGIDSFGTASCCESVRQIPITAILAGRECRFELLDKFWITMLPNNVNFPLAFKNLN